MLLHFEDQLVQLAVYLIFNFQGIIDLGQTSGFGKVRINDRPDDLDDGSDVITHLKGCSVS